MATTFQVEWALEWQLGFLKGKIVGMISRRLSCFLTLKFERVSYAVNISEEVGRLSSDRLGRPVVHNKQTTKPIGRAKKNDIKTATTAVRLNSATVFNSILKQFSSTLRVTRHVSKTFYVILYNEHTSGQTI